MKNSRILHPSNSRFWVLREWALHEVGRAGAAVLAEVEFLDRVTEEPGTFVASRARLVAALEGLVGTRQVDEALAALVERGWLIRREHREIGPRNLVPRVEFALDADAIEIFLQRKGLLRLRRAEANEIVETIIDTGQARNPAALAAHVHRRIRAEGLTAADRAIVETGKRRQAEAKRLEERTEVLLAAQTQATTPESLVIAETTLAALRVTLRDRASRRRPGPSSEFTENSKRKSR